MQSIELKKTVPLRLSKTLAFVIQNTFQRNLDDFKDDLKAIDDLRAECANAAISAASLPKLIRYPFRVFIHVVNTKALDIVVNCNTCLINFLLTRTMYR